MPWYVIKEKTLITTSHIYANSFIDISWTLLFILLGIIPSKFVATVSKEGVFSLSQLNQDTQLVHIDEWSTETMCSDTVKTVLQGKFKHRFCSFFHILLCYMVYR